MDEASKGKGIPYLDARRGGRVGYMINPADAPTAFGQAMCRVLSGEIIRAVTYYMYNDRGLPQQQIARNIRKGFRTSRAWNLGDTGWQLHPV